MHFTKMRIKRFSLLTLILLNVVNFPVNAKCYYTDCAISGSKKCEDGYSEQGSKLCLVLIFIGKSIFCCEGEITTPSASTTPQIITPSAPTTPQITPASESTTPQITTSTVTTDSNSPECSEVKEQEMPYVATLISQVIPGIPFCGGAILDNYWILTSARCLFDDSMNPVDPTSIVVSAGDFNSEINEGTEQKVVVFKAYIHEQYDINNDTQFANIALLNLLHPLNFNEWVSAIDVPYSDFDAKKSEVLTTIGWQAVNTLAINQTTNTILKKSNVEIVSEATCQHIYTTKVDRKGQIKIKLLESQMCVTQSTSCPAMSGGLLSCESYVCAIESYSKPHRGVYTAVSVFHDWVVNKLQKNT